MLGIQHQRGVHGLHPKIVRGFAVQKMKEMSADGIVIRFNIDAATGMREVVPIKQHGAEARHETIGNVPSGREFMCFTLRQYGA